MRARTEDLLTIRDGEPIDTAWRDRLMGDADNVREVARLARVADDLKRLPRLEPPPGLWPRIAAEASPRRSYGPRRAAGWAAAAALVAAAALLWPVRGPEDAVTTPAGNGAPSLAPLSYSASEPPLPDGGRDYRPLVAESARIELLLAELTRAPRRMSAGTARTIADLEDHIVLVDEQLFRAEASGVDPRYREALWRERVDVMSALLYVRYAQMRTY